MIKTCSMLGLVVSVVALVGCRSDPARDRSDNAVNTLLDAKSALLAGEKQVGQQQEKLATLKSGSGDLRPAFEAFRDQIPVLLKEADRLRIESGTIHEQATAFTSNWQRELATIQNQDLRQKGEDRAKEVRERYLRIDELYSEVNTAYSKYLSELKDLDTYLVLDLNYPALQTARQWFDHAHESGEALRSSIRALASELGTTTNVLSPIPMPMPQQPSQPAPATSEASPWTLQNATPSSATTAPTPSTTRPSNPLEDVAP